jgi:tetratricopeptide (TPR) repeat protein
VPIRSIIHFGLVGLLTVTVGCAAQRPRSAPPATAPSTASASPISTLPAADRAKAFLALEDIEPRVDIAKLAPSSQPTSRPSVEALTLYAEAMDALQTGKRFTAVTLLEKALPLDPQSFELNYALGRAYVIGRSEDEQSTRALERAAAIEPDHLELQTELGRQYLARGDEWRGLEHLRLAVQTTEYKDDEQGAGLTDLFLGRALQQAGYDRAALEQYGKVLRRVQQGGRTDPHLAFLITDRLYVDIGDLYARNGQLSEALQAYEPAAKRNPADFDTEARVVRALVGLRRIDEASRRAADAVVRFRASKSTLDLLREVHQANGSDGSRGAADALAKMYKERPDDTTVLFALIELLRENDRWAEGEGILLAASKRRPDDFTIFRRRVELRLQRDDAPGAAELIITTLAARPNDAEELAELWPDVISPARASHVRLAKLRAMSVPPAQAAAKEVAVATVAEVLHREDVGDPALERAVKLTPPFAPAYRERLARIWSARDATTDEAERTRSTDALIASAKEVPALADELRGLSLLYRKQYKDAATELGKAIAAGGAAPSLLLSHAVAVRESGDKPKFEQLMWKLLSDRPTFEDAYSTLYAYYGEAGSDTQADRVLTMWASAAPYSASARLLQAARFFRAGRNEAAEQTIAKLLEERGDDQGVIRTAYALYTRSGKIDTLVTTLEQRVRERPGNIAAVSGLVDLYEEKNRSADGLPMLDAARQAVADDPDALYQLSHLYARAGKQPVAEEVLAQVLAIEPTNPSASNDLGYGLADRGEQLAKAEALIRQAVTAEPSNRSFLDSLGWVLYKRGKFGEARTNLEHAIGASAADADPVVLDHLGDTLYRLGDRDAAAKQWEQAGSKLAKPEAGADSSDEIKRLKAALDLKAKQLKSGEPVTVSPVFEDAQQQQAKN